MAALTLRSTRILLPHAAASPSAQSYFGYKYSFIWWNVLIVAGYVLAFRLGSMLMLRFVNFERR